MICRAGRGTLLPEHGVRTASDGCLRVVAQAAFRFNSSCRSTEAILSGAGCEILLPEHDSRSGPGRQADAADEGGAAQNRKLLSRCADWVSAAPSDSRASSHEIVGRSPTGLLRPHYDLLPSVQPYVCQFAVPECKCYAQFMIIERNLSDTRTCPVFRYR